MFKTKQTVFAGIAVVLVTIGGTWIINGNRDGSAEAQNVEITQTETKKAEITFSEDKKTINYEGQSDKTALEVLKELTEVVLETSSFGEFVTGINGVEADSNSQYWSFYVDGDYANEGAGTYVTTDGEKIEWRLEDL